MVDHHRQEPRVVDFVDPGVEIGKKWRMVWTRIGPMFSVGPAAAFGAERALDQGQTQLADLVDQGLETLGFLHPFSDLLEEPRGT